MPSEVYKIVNDIASDYIKDLINIKQSNYNFRRENQASLPAVKSTRYGLRSFRYEATRIWNSLPNGLRLAESFPQFKRLFHTWDGAICGCPSCTSFVDLLCFYSVLCLLCLCARLFICALWSPAGKGLTSWLSFVVSNCKFVTFPLVSWVKCVT